MSDDVAKEMCIEVAKAVTKDIYNDGLQPAFKEVGKALGTVLGLANTVLTPVEMANAYCKYTLSVFMSDLENKTKNIPPEKLIEPQLRIAGPVLEGLKYTNDSSEIREMFLNLLVSAMNTDTESKTHPSFVETIKQLNTLDAKIFVKLSELRQVACAECILYKDATHVYSNAYPKFFVEEFFAFGDPFLISSSIKNLLRLGIIEHHIAGLIDYDYKKFNSHKYIKQITEAFLKINTESKLKITNQAINLNDYGKNFAKVCLSPSMTIINV